MGLLSLTEMVKIVKKHFLRIVALSLAVGLLSYYAISMMQTYTCTLGFKYNHKEAQEGLAPDGVSKLDPYEIQNPVIIKGALENMGMKEGDNGLSVKGIRQDISINKVVTELDKEVSKSAALLGEKYDVAAVEYEMKFTYDAALGDEFGPKMFSNIIKEYDSFLLAKYYNKKIVEDFAKIIKDSSADYIVISESMSNSLDNIISTLDTLSLDYPDFRSKVTGFSFSELSKLYQNLKEIQYAKYYGNVRQGNLAKDNEMVVKSYQAKVKELSETMDVDYKISENYKTEISSFYDSYKQAGLYRQAEKVQQNTDSSNNRDQDVIEDTDLEDYTNTYDDIILSYVERATNATDSYHTIGYYNTIIDSYLNDTVDAATKKELIKKNEEIMKEIEELSASYGDIASKTLNELYAGKVNDDLEYLILPEVTADKPVTLITVFLTILAFGLLVIIVLIAEMIKKHIDIKEIISSGDDEEDKKIIDTNGMSELHRLVYEQYLDDFSEFYLVYQPMIAKDDSSDTHMEAFIRWQSPRFGMVSPGNIIKCVSDFDIFKELNDWIVGSACKDIRAFMDDGKKAPVIHINCPYKEINDFAINDIIIKHISNNKISADRLCLELVGKDVAASLEDILLLEEMGIQICIDKFENSTEDREILSVIKPKYIKMSLDILNSDMYAVTDDDIDEANSNMTDYFADVIKKCHSAGISACLCGIEKESQDALADKMGFDFKQGYFYAKPEKIK